MSVLSHHKEIAITTNVDKSIQIYIHFDRFILKIYLFLALGRDVGKLEASKS